MSFTCADYETMLTAAQTALHDVVLGNKVAVLRYGTKEIEYSRDSNISELRAYVRELQDRVDACNGVTVTQRRPIQFVPY